MNTVQFLETICSQIHIGEKRAQAERKQELFGNQFMPELLVMRKDKVRFEIRRENTNHHEPHMHITHSDKIDLSVSLKDFSILAGKVDNKTFKQLLLVLVPKHEELKNIWLELNENENSVGAQKIIDSL
jgi:hypothetical protein